MSKELQGQALKYLALGLVGYFVYKKITGLGSDVVDFASKKLNPASQENLIYKGLGDAIGEDELSDAGLSFFDSIDTAAEWLGFENGINGVEGTTAELNKKIKEPVFDYLKPVG